MKLFFGVIYLSVWFALHVRSFVIVSQPCLHQWKQSTTTTTTTTTTTCSTAVTIISSSRLFGSSTSFFMKQKPGESDHDFFKRIQKAASNADQFEKMVTENRDNNINNEDARTKSTPTATATAKEQTNDSNNNNAAENQKGNYQRAEDWDAETKRKAKAGELMGEERLQYESQRYGNRFNQNEILRKNLKGF